MQGSAYASDQSPGKPPWNQKTQSMQPGHKAGGNSFLDRIQVSAMVAASKAESGSCPVVQGAHDGAQPGNS